MSARVDMSDSSALGSRLIRFTKLAEALLCTIAEAREYKGRSLSDCNPEFVRHVERHVLVPSDDGNDGNDHEGRDDGNDHEDRDASSSGDDSLAHECDPVPAATDDTDEDAGGADATDSDPTRVDDGHGSSVPPFSRRKKCMAAETVKWCLDMFGTMHDSRTNIV